MDGDFTYDSEGKLQLPAGAPPFAKEFIEHYQRACSCEGANTEMRVSKGAWNGLRDVIAFMAAHIQSQIGKASDLEARLRALEAKQTKSAPGWHYERDADGNVIGVSRREG